MYVNKYGLICHSVYIYKHKDVYMHIDMHMYLYVLMYILIHK
jgi:hypothetical protein